MNVVAQAGSRARRVLKRAGRAAAMGISVVLLAGCSVSGSVSPSTIPAAPSHHPGAMAVLGDSISVGYNDCARPGPCAAESWAGGADPAVDSIVRRLGRGVTVHNLAVPGSRMRNAQRELRWLTQPVQLITVFAGVNDVCRPTVAAMTAPAEFASDVQALLRAVRLQQPQARVLLLSIPDVTQLHRDRVGLPPDRLCGSVTLQEAAGRARIRARVEQMNGAIHAACAEYRRCVDDGGALFAHRILPSELCARDHFHPSVAGQRMIAAIAWRALTARGTERAVS